MKQEPYPHHDDQPHHKTYKKAIRATRRRRHCVIAPYLVALRATAVHLLPFHPAGWMNRKRATARKGTNGSPRRSAVDAEHRRCHHPTYCRFFRVLRTHRFATSFQVLRVVHTARFRNRLIAYSISFGVPLGTVTFARFKKL